MEILQADKAYNFCSITQRNCYGLQRHYIAGSTFEKSLLPLFVNERGIEPIVIQQANQFLSFRFGYLQLLDILNFLRGATSLHFFSKADKTSETKKSFSKKRFDVPEKLIKTQLHFTKLFFSKLRNNISLEKDYSDFQSSMDEGLTSKEALSQLKLKQSPATGQENYHCLTSVWQKDNMCTFNNFSR